ncbi:unnamed protein product [Rhizophagus irregularis]|nr:unnamed protein product [Rhizophagus irregularis]
MEIIKERRVNKVNNTFNDFLETTYRPRTWVIQKIESMIERLLFDIAKKRPPVINSVSNIKRKRIIPDMTHKMALYEEKTIIFLINKYNVKLFGNSQTVDLVIDELACFFQIPRSCLNVIASAKGLVAGSLKIIQKDRSILDCSKTSCQGTLIPTMDLIDNIL